MSDENKIKDPWDKALTISNIITAVIAAALSVFVFISQSRSAAMQQQIVEKVANLENTVKSVEAMVPLFDMIVGTDSAKCQMGAYALYMLNKDKPELAVNIIVTANRPELWAVLKNIGKWDKNLLDQLTPMLPKEGDSLNPKEKQQAKALQETVSTMAQPSADDHYIYLGQQTEDGKLTKNTVDMNGKASGTFTVVDAVNVRNAPNSDGRIVDVKPVGTKVNIMQMYEDDHKRVWGKVSKFVDDVITGRDVGGGGSGGHAVAAPNKD